MIVSKGLEFSLTIKAAWLKTVGQRNLSEIAQRLSLSTVKVHRLIAVAEESGLLKTGVAEYPEDCVETANKIKEQFSLKNCHVVPDKELSDEQSIKITGYAAAQILHGWLLNQHSGSIGIGKGRTMQAMVDALPKIERPDIDFIAISGSMQRNHAIMREDVIHNIASKTHGRGFLLPHPYFASTLQRKEELLSQKIIKELHTKAVSAKKIIAGVGNLEGNPIFQKYHLVEDNLWQKVIKEGGVADFLGTILDSNGNPVKSANNLSLGFTIENVNAQSQAIMAIAGGKSKGEAVLSALNSGVINDLVIGETSAETLLNE